MLGADTDTLEDEPQKKRKRDEENDKTASPSSAPHTAIPIVQRNVANQEEQEKVSKMMKYCVTLAHDMADRSKYIEMDRDKNATKISCPNTPKNVTLVEYLRETESDIFLPRKD